LVSEEVNTYLNINTATIMKGRHPRNIRNWKLNMCGLTPYPAYTLSFHQSNTGGIDGDRTVISEIYDRWSEVCSIFTM